MADRTMYCNQCGTPFTPEGAYSRFCSPACGSHFSHAFGLVDYKAANAWRQRQFLAILRQHPSCWVSTGLLSRTIYGDDSRDSVRATYYALRRLRDTWAERGLVVDKRRRNACAFYEYRLTRDAPDVLPAAS